MSRGPGKWQRVLLCQLQEEEGFLLFNCLCAHLGRTPQRAEYSTMYRAATLLAKTRGCRLERVWGENSAGARAALVWVCRPGMPVEGVARTAFEERLGVMPPG